MSLSLGDKVQQLWQLGLLRADLISSTEQLHTQGLEFIEQDDEGTYYYADNRQPQVDEKGFGGAIARLDELSSNIELYFHPFRYYVLYHLDGILNLRIHPMQMLMSINRYPELLDRQLTEFQQWTSSQNFTQLINHWNNITSLG